MGDIGGVIGGAMAQSTASNAQERMASAEQDAVNLINSIGAGPDLARQIYLEKYQQAGVLTPQMEQQINTHFQQIAGPSQGVSAAQKQALQQLTDLSKTGINAQDRLALNQIQTQTARDNQAQQNSIIQNLAARGQAGGGAELAARLIASQNGANQEAQGGLQVAANAQQRALQALGAMGSQANTMRGQEFTENQANTGIANEQNRFNTTNQLAQQQRNTASINAAQAANLQNKQNIMNANTSQTNQESQRQRQAEQQMYLNAANHASSAANARLGQGNSQLASGYNQAAAQAGMGQGLGQMGQGIYNAFKNSGNSSGSQNGGYDFSGSGQGDYNSYSGGSTANIGPVASGSEYGEMLYNHGGYVAGGPNEYCDGGPVQPYVQGGRVPGKPNMPGNHPENDTVQAKLSPGELVIPNSISHSPSKAKKFIDLVHSQEESGIHRADRMNSMEQRPGSSHGATGGHHMIESGMHKANHMNGMEQMPVTGGGNGYDNGGFIHLDPTQSPMGYDDGGYVAPMSQPDQSSPVDFEALMRLYQQSKPQMSQNPQPADSSPAQPSIFDRMASGIAMAGPSGGSVAPTSDNAINPNPMNAGPDMSNAGPQIVASAPGQNIFQQQQAQLSKPAPEKAAEEPKKENVASKDEESTPSTPEKAAEEAPLDKESPDYLEQLKAAYDKMHQGQAQALISRGAERFASAAGRMKPDYSYAESLEKQAGQPVEQVLTEIKATGATQNLAFNKEMADPDSKISKLFQDSLLKVNPNLKDSVAGVPADQLAKIFPQLVNVHKADILSQYKQTTVDQKKSDKKNAFISQSRERFAKHDESFQAAQDAYNQLDRAQTSKNPINDVQALYAFVHTMNPKAIVRPNATKMETDANGALGNLELRLGSILGGREKLTPETLNEMKNSIKPILDQKQKSHAQLQKSYMDQYKGLGGDESTFNQIDPSYGQQAASGEGGGSKFQQYLQNHGG